MDRDDPAFDQYYCAGASSGTHFRPSRNLSDLTLCRSGSLAWSGPGSIFAHSDFRKRNRNGSITSTAWLNSTEVPLVVVL